MSNERGTLLITAGPTREPIDPVRYVSNRSSGKMGYAIADAAIEAGYHVVLISGPVAIQPPPQATLVSVITGDEMFDAVAREILHADVFVMCAAVADYKPRSASPQKVKKKEAAWMLELEPNRDIIATVPRGDRVKVVVGFAAETHDLEKNAQEKMRRKKCDLLVANDVSGDASGMESDYNAGIIYVRGRSPILLERMPKRKMADALLKIIASVEESY